MEKQKRWHFYLILVVFVLTLYNILPTIFYYAQPLREPVDQDQAMQTAKRIVERVEKLEQNALDWVSAEAKHLNLKLISTNFDEFSYGLIEARFQNVKEANIFRNFLKEAGTRISNPVAQLQRSPLDEANSETVIIQRAFSVHLAPENVDNFFVFGEKTGEKYQEIVKGRTRFFLGALLNDKGKGELLEALAVNDSLANREDLFLEVVENLVEAKNSLEETPLYPLYLKSFGNFKNVDNSRFIVNKFGERLEQLKGKLNNRLTESETGEGNESEEIAAATKESLTRRLSLIEQAQRLLKDDQAAILAGSKRADLLASFEQAFATDKTFVSFDLNKEHPFFSKLTVDLDKDEVRLQLNDEAFALLQGKAESEEESFQKAILEKFVFEEINRLKNETDEEVAKADQGYFFPLAQLPGSETFLALDLKQVAGNKTEELVRYLSESYFPSSSDLKRENYPIWSYESYRNLPAHEQKLGMLVMAPVVVNGENFKNLNTRSIYVILRGMGKIMERANALSDKQFVETFQNDFAELSKTLQSQGFFGYAAPAYFGEEFAGDIIFELTDFYEPLLKATYEDFYVRGRGDIAILEFTDYEQRLLKTNEIDSKIHDEILKWRDQYYSAQVDTNPAGKYFVPPPTKNAYIENIKLNFKKFFRGDDRKILKWGLDLAGGKQVRIGLRDQNMRPVSAEEDLNQAVNELYSRVNKMGVSEVNIHIENENIILDFPGSQGLSASDLIKGSAMYFHIVNEQFSEQNEVLRNDVNQFLQEVWNEAQVTGKTDAASLNEIALEHLGGATGLGARPMTQAAQALKKAGLKLASPDEPVTSAFDDTVSKVARLRGDDIRDWQGKSHPLMIVFKNYALEGASLENIHTGQDQKFGNILIFGVRSSYGGGQEGSPRQDLYTWTSEFSGESIVGTLRAEYSGGDGYRMAVILNGEIISSPRLNEPLREQASIHGRFSQREVSKLASDLKAGSMTYTPEILSEQNISPDLGKTERVKGIQAALLGLCLVVGIMVAYYRFAGIVASVAIIFNLLIMWGILQNLDAALTLPGIAGIILTMGMAVDANVLVFERIREEYLKSKRLGSAIAVGYRKAFSAIVDSNLTTIIAALILIQFDSGPIKGFATTLSIGIASSMFTALFMTRFFFAGWIQKGERKELSMANWFGNMGTFNFFKLAKPVVPIFLMIIVCGNALNFVGEKSILGMDFTGGYSLTVDLQPNEEISYKKAVTDALINAGASHGDVSVQTLNKPHQLKVQLGMSMEDSEKPFYNLPQTVEIKEDDPKYRENPRIAWVVDALQKGGLSIQEDQKELLPQSWTSMSGQFSDAMRYQALYAIGLALISILIYTTYRFEFIYAISAILALAHDVLIALGVLALMHYFGVPVQIDLQVIGAIMTIIGYSLNDTIIVFDRIREDERILKRLKMPELINHALNATLSRTMMTSLTTLVVLLALVLFGGQAIFDFSFVMLLGVIFGTFSTLFIAAPLLLFFHKRQAEA